MPDSLRYKVRRLPFFPIARHIYRRLRRPRVRHRLQGLAPADGFKLKRLGSDYGGWTFVDDPKLARTTIISAGLGEDASFNVEFANAHGARAIIVNPTPRAIVHFEEIRSRLGKRRERDYVIGGRQHVEAYALDGLTESNFSQVPKVHGWGVEFFLRDWEQPTGRHRGIERRGAQLSLTETAHRRNL